MSFFPSNQSILWRFETPLVGSDLAQVNAGVLIPGIYSGLVASSGGGAVVSVSAGSCLINDSASFGTSSAKLVKVTFEDGFNYTCDTSNKYRFLVIRFTWSDSVYSSGVSGAYVLDTNTVEPYDIILCALEWSGTNISIVDAASATQGYISAFEQVFNNIIPTVSPTVARTINIASGRFVYSHSSVSYAGGSVQLDAASSSARFDLVGIDPSGTIVVVKGTEGGGQPSLGNFLPVCMVHIRVGVASFLSQDISDIRPLLTFAGLFSATDISADMDGLGNLPEFVTVQDLITWLNTSLFSGSSVNANSLQGNTPVSSITGSPSADTIPTAPAVKTYVDGVASSVMSEVESGFYALSSGTLALALARITFLINKDIGQTAFFAGAKDLSTGWIRADGSVIDSSVNPEYGSLVSFLKGIVGSDTTHPYYAVSGTQAKLPNLQDRYVKDIGTSGLKEGGLVAGDLKQHTHSVVIAAASPDTHVHAMPHSHSFSSPTGAADGGSAGDSFVNVHIGSHSHSLTIPHHKHTVTINDGIKSISSGGANSGAFGSFGYSANPVDFSQSPEDFNSKDEVYDSGSPSLGSTNLGDVAGQAPHTHSIPATSGPSNTNTSTAAPDTHSHGVTVGDAGSLSTNEVDKILCLGYIFFGVSSALM